MRCAAIKNFLMGAGLAALLVVTGCGSSPTSVGPAPTTVAVTPLTATVFRGKTQQFLAQVSGPGDQTVMWSVPSNVGSIDDSGLYTAPANSDGVSVTVRATSKAAAAAFATATVTLPSVAFTIAPDVLVIAPGSSHTFSATVVGLSSAQVGWSVQGAGGGTITSTGVYTASSTIGIYSVVATSSVNTNYSAAATVAVTTTPTSFSPTGNLNHGREFHTATLLADGKTLVAGGGVYEAYCIAGRYSAELYDAALGVFTSTGTMTDRRYAQTATLLQNGEVLITGGFSFNADACLYDETSPALASAELYDPSSGSFALTDSMTEARGDHTATLLLSGKVLIAGGGKDGGDYPPFANVASATAEVYDPATGAFTLTGSMTSARTGQTATLLANGKVLIVGGLASASANPLATAELYDPATGAFTLTRQMEVGRAGHTATLLQDGRVLVTGGLNDQTPAALATAEIYDPATESFVATGSMTFARLGHTATLLPDGTVLVVGGGTLVAEIYDPSTASFFPSALTEFNRSGHSATLLQNGRVIVIGGGLFGSSSTSAELYP
jgi:Galactose oxidase, central domain